MEELVLKIDSNIAQMGPFNPAVCIFPLIEKGWENTIFFSICV